MNAMLMKHEQPAVLSAVMKYETTNRSRLVVNDAMDVLGGAGICRGPSNIMGNTYMSIPIAVTVEGANILTRSMIIFGQGLNRAHPHLINIVNTIEKGDDPEGFMREVRGIVGHALSNVGRSITRAILRPRWKRRSNLLGYYEGQVSRLAANFALSCDLGLVLGGKLKVEEMVSGRFADAFGTLYLAYASMWFYQQHRDVQGIDTLFELSMETLLAENQAALTGLAANFPIQAVGSLMHLLTFPTGEPYQGPSDRMRKAAAEAISTPTGVRELLSEGIFISKNPSDRLNMLNAALPEVVKMDQILASAKKSKRALTVEEEQLVARVQALVNDIVQVDSFDKLGMEKRFGDEYVRPALRHTRFVTKEEVAEEEVKAIYP